MKKRVQGFAAGILIGTLLLSGTAFAKQIRETAELVFNNIKIFINGNELYPVDADGNYVEPFIIEGTTYLPVRAISNAFGKNVEWDGETQSIYINDRIVYNKTEYDVYNEKISEYIEAATVGWDTFINRWNDDSSVNSESMRDYYNYSNKILAYALHDIDNNGVPELVFSNLSEPKIYDIYTINNGSLIKLFGNAYFGYRSILHILSDGRLLTEGSSSAFESSMEIHTINFGCALSDAERYYFVTREHSEEEYFGDGTEITVEEYTKKLEQLKSESVFDTLDWVVFAQ